MEAGLDKRQVISELTRSPHGKLEEYVPVGRQAALEDPDFFGHLLSWNRDKGQVRDAKTALPVIALTSPALRTDDELRENALAHIVSLDPRNMVRAVRFARGQPVVTKRGIRSATERYLRHLEAHPQRFERVALRHRASLRELYALQHIKPGVEAQKVLFEGTKAGVWGVLASLKDASPTEIAGAIQKHKLPFLNVRGALGAKAKDPEVVQALMGAMTATELVTNTKALQALGLDKDPGLRATFEAGLGKVAGSSANVLKTTRAAEAIGGKTAEKLRGAQEKQLDAIGMDGDWLVLADKSASMTEAIEVARVVAATLARAGKGRVHVVFFDTSTRYLDATGMDYDKILAETKRVTAGGGTSIGVGASYAAKAKLAVDGIAIVSDGAENSPPLFTRAYAELCEAVGKRVPCYLYWMRCHSPNTFNNNPDALAMNCKAADVELDVFDLRNGTDYYALPNLIATMRSNRYSLIDEILASPLLRLGDVITT